MSWFNVKPGEDPVTSLMTIIRDIAERVTALETLAISIEQKATDALEDVDAVETKLKQDLIYLRGRIEGLEAMKMEAVALKAIDTLTARYTLRKNARAHSR